MIIFEKFNYETHFSMLTPKFTKFLKRYLKRAAEFIMCRALYANDARLAATTRDQGGGGAGRDELIS